MSVSAEQMLARDLEVINEMTTAVTSTLDLAEIVRIALSRIKMLASAEAISLLRYDAERDELVFDDRRIVADVEHRGRQVVGTGQRVEGDGRGRPSVMSGLDVDRHAAEVAMGDRWYPASYGEPARDVVREAEHHASLQRLAER